MYVAAHNMRTAETIWPILKDIYVYILKSNEGCYEEAEACAQ